MGSEKDRPALGDAAPLTSAPGAPGALVSPVGLAKHLAVSVTTVRRLVDEKAIPVILVGKLIRFDIGAVREALATRTRETEAKKK